MVYQFLFWRIHTCHGCLVARHKASSRLVSLAFLVTMTLSICLIDGEKCGISVLFLRIHTCHGCLVARHKASSRMVSLALLATMTLSICWIDGEKCGI